MRDNDFSRLRHPRSMRQVDGQEFGYLRPDLTFRNDGRYRPVWVPLIVAIILLLWACAA